MVHTAPDIRVLVDCKTILGEGPLWDVETQRLYWIDSFGNKVFRSTAEGTEVQTWDVPAKIGSMALRRSGEGAIVSLQNGFHALDFRSGECYTHRRPRGRYPFDAPERRQGRPARPVRLRIDGHAGSRTERRALSARHRYELA